MIPKTKRKWLGLELYTQGRKEQARTKSTGSIFLERQRILVNSIASVALQPKGANEDKEAVGDDDEAKLI